MSKSRIMGAGSAGSSIYNCNVNLKTCGGTKKQGLPFCVGNIGYNHIAIKIKSIGNNRDVIFTINQLGGVSSSSFSSTHSNSGGDGVNSKLPFICSPYCNISPIQTKVEPLIIPEEVIATLIVPSLDIFSYSNYDGCTHCYTDSSKMLLNTSFMVGNISLKSYLMNIYPSITDNDIHKIVLKLKTALKQEDTYTGDLNLLLRDRVLGTLYSLPSSNGFMYGTSICSQLYNAMLKNYPDKIATCPSRQSILQSGDEFMFNGVFNYNTIKIIFNIKII